MARVWLTMLMLLWGGAVAAQGKSSMDDFLNDLRSLKSAFTQVLLDEQNNLLEESSGTLYLQRPDHFRWDYETPYRQEIVADGQKVWMYDSDLEQVTVRKVDDAVGSTPALLLSSEQPVEANFIVEDQGTNAGTNWVALKPRSNESDFESIRLGFAAQSLTVMELKDQFGQLTRLNFSSVERNPSIGEETFRFVAPEGVDILSEE